MHVLCCALLILVSDLRMIGPAQCAALGRGLSTHTTCQSACEDGFICDTGYSLCVKCEEYCEQLNTDDCPEKCSEYAIPQKQGDKLTDTTKQPTEQPSESEDLYKTYFIVLFSGVALIVVAIVTLVIIAICLFYRQNNQRLKLRAQLSHDNNQLATLLQPEETGRFDGGKSNRAADTGENGMQITTVSHSDRSLERSKLAICTPVGYPKFQQTEYRLSVSSLYPKQRGNDVTTIARMESESAKSRLLAPPQPSYDFSEKLPEDNSSNFYHDDLDDEPISNMYGDVKNLTQATNRNRVNSSTIMDGNDVDITKQEMEINNSPPELTLDPVMLEASAKSAPELDKNSSLIPHCKSISSVKTSVVQRNCDVKTESKVDSSLAKIVTNCSEASYTRPCSEMSSVFSPSVPQPLVAVGHAVAQMSLLPQNLSNLTGSPSKDLLYACSRTRSCASRPCTNGTRSETESDTEVKEPNAISTALAELSVLPCTTNEERAGSSNTSGLVRSNNLSDRHGPEECVADRDADYVFDEDTEVKPRFDSSESGYDTTATSGNVTNSVRNRHDLLSRASVSSNNINEQCNSASNSSDEEEEDESVGLLPIPSNEQYENGPSNNEPSLCGGYFDQAMAVNNVASNRAARVQPRQPINNVPERQHYHSSNIDVHACERDNLLQDDARVAQEINHAPAANNYCNDQNGNAPRDDNGQLECAGGGIIGSVEDEYDGGIMQEAMPLAELGEVSYIARSITDDSGAGSIYNPDYQDRSGFHIQHHNNNPIYEQLQNMPWVLGYHSQGRSISVYADLDQHDEDDLHQQLVDVMHQPWEKFRVKSNH